MKKLFTSFLSFLLVFSLMVPTALAEQTTKPSSSEVQEQNKIELEVSRSLFSLTEARTVDITVDFGEAADLANLKWEFGGKSLDQWKSWDAEKKEYSGKPFISVSQEPHYVGTTTKIKAQLKFDLPYGTEDLSPRSIRVQYPKLMGNYELKLSAPSIEKEASTTVKLNVYDEYLQYDEIKPALDRVFSEADTKNNRYLEYKSLGKSAEGRDIHFVVLARDQKAVKKYLDQTLPLALEDPEKLLKKLEKGNMGDYQIPIWFNNIHPDEVEGVDAQVELLEKFALENKVEYKTTDADGKEKTVTLDVKKLLDHVIFLFNFTHNPDGRVANTRANANGFDLNRDNAYQTQVETIAVDQEIAKWTPISFIDMHGYVKEFLFEPGTPPHNPNFEYDLLVNNMVEQAHAMGRAGVANSNNESYIIPLFDWGNGWDDMTPAYTAIFAMLHGSLGHTIEVPTLGQDALYAMLHAGLGASSYVYDHKDKLFKNQLELFKRGINNEDNRAVDEWYVNQAGEKIGRIRGEYDNFFPDYYVIPLGKDQKNALEATNMVNYLVRNGIKVEQINNEITVNDKTYAKGTYIVPMNQAKRGLANAMLYKGDNVSDWEAMYDPIVVNFPALRGFDIDTVRVKDAFKGKTKAVKSVAKVTSLVDTSASLQVVSNNNNDVIKLVNELLKKGKIVELVKEESGIAKVGDFVISTNDLTEYANQYVFDAKPVAAAPKVEKLAQTKVAVIGSAQSKYSVKELGFELVDPKDASIIIDDSGAFKKEQLDGKTYLGIGGRALAAVKKAELLSGFDFKTTDLYHEGLIKTDVTKHSLTAGYSENELLYVATGTWVTAMPKEAQVLATVANTDDFYVAGWWPGHSEAKGQTLAFNVKQGNTTYTLFANDLAFRAHTQHSYRLLANSIFNAK